MRSRIRSVLGIRVHWRARRSKAMATGSASDGNQTGGHTRACALLYTTLIFLLSFGWGFVFTSLYNYKVHGFLFMANIRASHFAILRERTQTMLVLLHKCASLKSTTACRL